jgi:hypothetical protein
VRRRRDGLEVDGIIRNEVIDLTRDGIDQDVKSYLSLGPGFAETHQEVPYEDYIAGVEKVCQMIKVEQEVGEITEQQSNEQQTKIRKEIQKVMKTTVGKRFKSNLKPNEKRGRNKARNSDDHVFLPADKGKIMVAMDRKEGAGEQSYEFKMKKVMEELKAKKSVRAGRDWDPTESVSRKGREIVASLVSRKEITEFEGDRMKPVHGHAPRVKGLPKAHKDGMPLRGVVSFIGSPFQEVSRFLVPILKRLQGRTGLFVKNSRELKERVERWDTKGKVLVSYDVVSMYPSIPIQKALELINRLLRETNEWKGNNKELKAESVMKLLE